MTETNPEIDYLAVGHIARDLKADGYTLGGTVAYSGRTAAALGRVVGIVTACAESTNLAPLTGIQVHRIPAPETTTFENVYEQAGRKQIIHAIGPQIGIEAIPPEWRRSKLVHLAPIANEVDQNLIHHFRDSFIGATPQGWMRRWDSSGRVIHSAWETFEEVLRIVDAIVLSSEDLRGQEGAAASIAQICPILALTMGSEGAIIFQNGEPVTVKAPVIEEVDPTGSGDIFAAAFFTKLEETGDPLKAGVFATELASNSIIRSGVESTPSASEIQALRDKL